jgi:hypothetical protein
MTTFPNLPKVKLTNVIGKPDAITVALLTREIEGNCYSVPCTQGGGDHGFLGMVQSDEKYAAAGALTPYIRAPHPGEAADLPDAASIRVISRHDRIHATALKAHDTTVALEKVIANQIIEAVDETYLEACRNEFTGQIEQKPYLLLLHMQTKYGNVTDKQIEDNRNGIQAPWVDPSSFETFENHMIKSQKFSRKRTGNGITDHDLIMAGVNVITRTGKFEKALDSWYELDDAARRSWAEFTRHFSKAVDENTRKQRAAETTTAAAAGYHGANHVDEVPAAPPDANAARMEQLEAKLDVALAALAQRPPAPGSGPPTNANATRTLSANHYCWTHGFCGHLSPDCQQKDSRHKDAATANNKMGGLTIRWQEHLRNRGRQNRT